MGSKPDKRRESCKAGLKKRQLRAKKKKKKLSWLEDAGVKKRALDNPQTVRSLSALHSSIVSNLAARRPLSSTVPKHCQVARLPLLRVQHWQL